MALPDHGPVAQSDPAIVTDADQNLPVTATEQREIDTLVHDLAARDIRLDIGIGPWRAMKRLTAHILQNRTAGSPDRTG